MKLYLLHINTNNININEIKNNINTNFKNSYVIEKIIKYIYSEKGIIEIDKNGKLWNIEINDIMQPYIYNLNNTIQLYIDGNTIKKKDEAFQIIPEHFSIIINKIIFSITPKSIVKLIIEIENNNITNVYFETEIDFQHFSVKEEILTFLNILNFHKFI